MATLSKHNVVGILEFMTRREAIGGDGQVLVNHGQGWKIKGKLKQGIVPVEHFNRRAEKLADKEKNMPLYAELKRKLHAYVPQTHRWMVMAAIEAMPGDPDGVWSEVNDHGDYRYSIDLDEAVELCRLYEASLREAREAAQLAR